MESFPLHQHPEYLDECVNILNEEWPRSKTARLHSLQKSCDNLPFSMVLVRSHGDHPRVIGHSKLSRVQGHTQACFVESVIVPKALRGQGLGRKVMVETERHAARLGFTTIYLTTHDKQAFYGHVGYACCEPVVALGAASSLLSPQQLNRLLGSGNSKDPQARGLGSQTVCETGADTGSRGFRETTGGLTPLSPESTSPCGQNAAPLTPAPPPLPAMISPSASGPTPLLLLPPPPPPPPPPLLAGPSIRPLQPPHTVSQRQSKFTEVVWMRKDLVSS